MGHVKTFSFKILLNGLPLMLILMLLGKIGWITALIVTAFITVAAYIIGDLIILPETGNFTATVTDGGLVFFLLWLSRYFGLPLSFLAILLSAAAVMMVEGLIYHPYLNRLVSVDSIGPRIGDRE